LNDIVEVVWTSARNTADSELVASD
jgi:hypothetical protein